MKYIVSSCVMSRYDILRAIYCICQMVFCGMKLFILPSVKCILLSLSELIMRLVELSTMLC